MRSCDKICSISKMANATMLTIFLFLFFASAAVAEKKKSSDKIIIHVPYKIHKHHHTHTKYKVITIPAPKKENTVIYLKEQIRPVIKEVPTVHTDVKIAETEPKVVFQAPQMITPPHQQSAQSFLESVVNHKPQNSDQTDQPQEYSTITDDQKSLETNSAQKSENTVSSLTYKPVILPSQENIIQDYAFKSVAYPPIQAFTPKFVIPSAIHHSYESFFPKFTHQPLVHLPQGHFNSPYTFSPLLNNPKVLRDSVAHTSSQVYKTVLPGPKPTHYKVKEENQEGEGMHLIKHQLKQNSIQVPSYKSTRKGKAFVSPRAKYQLKPISKTPSGDFEYEHVGYLIIDGNSRKIVDKNFKDELHLPHNELLY